MRHLPILAFAAGCAGDGTTPVATTGDTGTTTIATTTTTATFTTTEVTGDPLIVDGVEYWPVLVSVGPDPNYFRLQINYADADGLASNPTEPGQNSTFGLTLTLVDAPAGPGSWTWTDSRFSTDPSEINGYISFFNNTGHPHAGMNFLSPAGTTAVVSFDGGRWRTELSPMTFTDEGTSGTTIAVEGVIDAAWSP